MLSLSMVQRCSHAERAQRTVKEIMHPLDAHIVIAPGATAADALQAMAAANVGCLLVVEGDHLTGLIAHSGIARFVQFKSQLEAEA